MSTVVLFRQNPRLKDNPVLALAKKMNQPIIPLVLIQNNEWNRTWFKFKSMGPFRKQFIMDCVIGLDLGIKALGGQLWVSLDSMATTLQAINAHCQITQVITTKEVGHYERCFEAHLSNLCQAFQVPVTFIWDHTLIQPEDLPFDVSDTPNSFSSFRKKIEMSPLKIPAELTDDGSFYAGETPYPLEKAWPSQPSTGSIGEQAAWAHVNDYLWESNAILHYKDTRNLSHGHHVSTKLSSWLSMGVLSARQIMREIQTYEKKVKKNISTYWVFFELLWRDFFHFQSVKHGLKWYNPNGILDQNEPVPKYDEDRFTQWANGETSEPYVNAHMKELITTGYMSNRARQVVASYLIHNLNQDWRRGAELFEHYLIDYDVASNYGNWMYIAGVGNSRNKRIFNVQKQAKKYGLGNTSRNGLTMNEQYGTNNEQT
jgi:deoxyribodipyrimidine photo-lyase